MVKLKYFLLYQLRSIVRPFIVLTNMCDPELFMSIHWTTIWLLKDDWIMSKINGSNDKWEDVINNHLEDINKTMEDFMKRK